MLERACAGLFIAPGLGKTSITFAAYEVLRAKGLVKKMLVLAPLRVCYSTWPAEGQKWDEFQHLSVGILHGLNKDKVLAENHDVYVMNYEGLKWLEAATRHAPMFDVLVIDESSKLKHTNTQRFKILKKMLGKFKRRYILTGSPAANSLLDIFGQVFCMDQGATFGPYISHYRDLYFFQTGFGGYEWKLKPNAATQIQQLLAPRVMRMAAEDYLEMPDLIKVNITVDLPEEAQLQYLKMEKKLQIEVAEGKVTAVNAAVAAGKCIAEGTEVLTNKGWILIENYTPDLKVWDGISWINADKLQFNGIQEVVTCYNIKMTAAHKVLTAQGWRQAGDIINEQSGEKFTAANFRLPGGSWASAKHKAQSCKQTSSMVCSMPMWQSIYSKVCLAERPSQTKREKLRLYAWAAISKSARHAWHVFNKTMENMARNARVLPKYAGQGLAKLWRTGYKSKYSVAEIRKFLGRYASYLCPQFNFRSHRQYARLFKDQLPMGNYATAMQQPQSNKVCTNKHRPATYSSTGQATGYKVYNAVQASNTQATARVYDIINAGPLERFTVRSPDGQALLVHNCRQIASGSVYDEQGEVHIIHSAKVEALQDLVEELEGQPLLVAYEYTHEATAINAAFGGKLPIIGGGMTVKQGATIIDKWNAGEIPLLLAQSSAVSHGVNLQHGGSSICWFTLTYNLETYEQFIARVYRQGQTQKVFVYHLVANKTIDNAVLAIVAKKDKLQQSLLTALADYWAV